MKSNSANSGNEMSSTLFQACRQHLNKGFDEVAHINRIAGEIQEEALTGQSHLSLNEASELLTMLIGIQVTLGIARKIFSKMYKEAEQAEEATKRRWELIEYILE